MSPMLQVFRKELREMFRDKRVRSSAFIMPPLLIAGIVFLLGMVMQAVGKPQGQKIHIVRSQHPLAQALRKAQFTIVEVDTVAEGERLIRDGKARLLLDFGKSVRPASGQQTVRAYLDPKQQTGQIAFAMASRIFDEYNKATLAATLARHGIPQEAKEAIKVERQEVQVGSRERASDLVVSMLPYLIVLMAFQSGFTIAADLVAGEKEKNTLETLIITPIRRTEIVLGKFLALSVVCLLGALSAIIGFALISAINLPSTRLLFQNGLGVSPTALLIILAVLLPTVAFFASLLIGVSSYAKNMREAQTHLGLVFFVVIMPAVFSQVIGLTDMANARWVSFVPVLNTANNIRNALLGRPDAFSVVATIAISLVLAILALRWAVWLFNREQVLTRV